jgi:hypothetical protein
MVTTMAHATRPSLAPDSSLRIGRRDYAIARFIALFAALKSSSGVNGFAT